MHLEKRLSLRLAAEDINILESEEDLEASIQSKPDRNTYRAIFDAIKKFFNMGARDLFQFATEGGSIEEGLVVIESLTPQLVLEQEIHRTVQSGNYYKVLEVRMPGQGLVYKGFIVAKLANPNDRIEKALQSRMAGWKPGQKVPFTWYKTEAEALKAMSELETSAAGKSPTPVKPTKQKISKAPVNKIAAKMAEHMGAQEAAEEIITMSNENIVRYADLGIKTKQSGDSWKMAKTVFLAYLSLAALVTGAAGLAALVIGYLAVKGWEAHKKKQESETQAPINTPQEPEVPSICHDCDGEIKSTDVECPSCGADLNPIKEDINDENELPQNMVNDLNKLFSYGSWMGDGCRIWDCGERIDKERFHAAHEAAHAEAVKRGLEDPDKPKERKWGADPADWQTVWDEVMGQWGFERNMSQGPTKWVSKIRWEE